MKKSKQPEEMVCPAWMMTFGDCMSLLVTFFVMLIAFSTFEEAQLAALIGSLKGAFGISPPPSIETVVKDHVHSEQIRGMVDEPRWLSAKELSAVVPDLQMALKRFGSPSLGSDRYLAITMLDEGLAFVISVTPLFEPGSSGLLPGNEDMLDEIAKFIDALANEARIIGVVHECARVRSPTSRTPWGLAVERAMAVQDGFMNIRGLSRDRFGIGARLEAAPETPGQEAERSGATPWSWQSRAVPYSARAIFESERIEIVIIGRRMFDEVSPEEIIVRDKWE